MLRSATNVPPYPAPPVRLLPMFRNVCIQHAWKLVPTGKGLLSEKEYVSRAIEFEMTVIAHIQRDRADAPETREFKKSFDLTFEVRGIQR